MRIQNWKEVIVYICVRFQCIVFTTPKDVQQHLQFHDDIVFVRLTDTRERFILNLKVCDPAVSRFLYRKTFCDLQYNAEHKSDEACYLEYCLSQC